MRRSLWEQLWLTVLLCLCAGYLAMSFTSSWASEKFLEFGPALFPRVVGLVLVTLTAVALARTSLPGWRRPQDGMISRLEVTLADEPVAQSQQHATATGSVTRTRPALLVLGSVAAIACFVVLLVQVGAATAVAAFTGAAMVLVGQVRWPWALGWGVVAAASIYSIFVLWLNVRLPAPILI